MEANNAKENRQYKDSMFSKLFNSPAPALGLYNALTGADYPPETGVEIVTLENVLFLDRLNDLAFIIGGKLIVLIEHQSSTTENIALRFLLYIAQEYEALTSGKHEIYKSKRYMIPKPEFIVLYNGEKSYPARSVERLSTSYIQPDKEPGIESTLELTATVINIHAPENAEIVERNTELLGYVRLVKLIRQFQSEGESLRAAIRHAIRVCIENDILTDFLHANASEVENMLVHEFSLADAKEVWTEEAFEEGREQGIEQGIELVARNLLRSGYDAQFVSSVTGLPLGRVEELS